MGLGKCSTSAMSSVKILRPSSGYLVKTQSENWSIISILVDPSNKY